MTTAQSVHVELAGIRLSVRTDASKERVQSIVKDIERRLREINEQAQNAPLNRRLILAALMLGEDLMQARTDAEEASEKAESLKDQAAQSSEQLNAKSKELGLLQQKLESLIASKTSLETKVAEHDAKGADLQAQLSAAVERAERAERQAEESAAALADTQAELEQALKERTDLSQATASSSARQDELEETVRTQEAAIEQLQRRSGDVADKAQTALKLVEDSDLVASR